MKLKSALFGLIGCTLVLGLISLVGCAPPDKDTDTPAPKSDASTTTATVDADAPPVDEPAEEPAEPAEEPAEPAEEPAEPAEEPAEPAEEPAEPAEEPAEPAEEPAEQPEEKASDQPAPESAEFTLEIPLGLPELKIPDDNPMTAEKVALGKLLYFDTRLSKNKDISCATCHDPKMAWTEHKATSEGIGGHFGERNSPTVINAAYAPSQFWDGRAATLEEQAVGPIENPIEMGHDMTVLVPMLNDIPEYKKRFQSVFGTDVNEEGIAKAIAAFERTVLSGNSAYDKFKDGDESALTDQQKNGMQLFNESCVVCHAPPLFSNYTFMNAGIGMDAEEPDVGRKEVTGNDRDMGKFRVPMLRDVEKTYPYFHDGSAEKLEEAVKIMAQGGIENPNLSPMMKAVKSAELSEEDQKDIVAFLKSLNGEYPMPDPPELP